MAIHGYHAGREPSNSRGGSMSRDYPRLPIEEFGAHLLRSGDLDPIYIALRKVRWELPFIKRWLLAYWGFYSAATAGYIADAVTMQEYWKRWKDAAENLVQPLGLSIRFPRGHERRHMRGKAAMDCYEHLSTRYKHAPHGFVDYVLGDSREEGLTCRGIMKRVADHVQFGPWIGFKIADMAERVLGVPVSFEHAEVFMFDDPKKAALMLWRKQTGQPENAKPRDEGRVLREVVSSLTNMLSGFPAPPLNDRPVGLQEVETILCKWKSHCNGHYPLGNDIREIRAGLEPWLPCSAPAREFLTAMPEVV